MRSILAIVGILTYGLLWLLAIVASLGVPIAFIWILIHFAMKWW